MRVARYSRFVPISLVIMWLSLVAGLAQAAEVNQQQPLSNNDQVFLSRAMSDNASQIAMAKLALAKSSNPRVIELANTIIQERSTLDARLAQLMPRSRHAASDTESNPMVSRLQSLDGDTFDQTFASTAVRSHCRIIAAYQAMKLTSSNPVLKDLGREAVPALRGSLTVAMSVLRSSGLAPERHQEAVASADTRGSKAPVFWEPISLVAAPW